MLVDAHCHLGDGAFDDDREQVIERARAAGIAHIVVIGESLSGSERAWQLARDRPGLSATAGVHPHDASTWTPDVAARIRELQHEGAVVAVGETGLDYHYDHSPRDAQRRAFEAQLSLAAELRRPVVVHAREADADMATLVREWGPRVPALVLHSFSSGVAVFEAGLEAGAYFSYSGMITFKNWKPAAPPARVSLDRLLVETDAPYLAPVPHRGGRNEPAFVRYVAAALARVVGTDPDELGRRVVENGRRVFGERLAELL